MPETLALTDPLTGREGCGGLTGRLLDLVDSLMDL